MIGTATRAGVAHAYDFSTNVIPAMFAACVWILLVFAVTQAIGWHLDKKAQRLVRR